MVHILASIHAIMQPSSQRAEEPFIGYCNKQYHQSILLFYYTINYRVSVDQFLSLHKSVLATWQQTCNKTFTTIET